MNIFITILVTFFAGMGAGLGTGFAGMSAAAVISPMLITFLGIDPYMAVGIALSSDVLASAVSAYTLPQEQKSRYKKRYHHDDYRACVHNGRELYRKPCSHIDYGRFFGVYDFFARHKIYRAAGYDH